MSKVALGPYGEPLVNNVRLDKVFVHLSRLVKQYPSSLRFATQLQDAIPSPDPATIKGQPETAVFMVISDHPKAGQGPYPEGHVMISLGSMPYTQWREIDKEYKHYASLSDPLRPIFAKLLRDHLDTRKNLEELN